MIRRIYRQLIPHGATVTESAMVRERDTPDEREVDVLITVPVADSHVRIAVECRDHARPADVEWIDSLIGKYRDLHVDRIVAVARKGFTAGAKAKATANRIEMRSLREALAADWPADLELANVARITVFVHPEEITIDASPQLEGRTPVRVICRGEDLAIGEYFKRCHTGIYNEFMKTLEVDPEKQFGTIDALNRTLELQFEVRDEDTTFLTNDGAPHSLNRMWWRCSIELSTTDLVTKRELFGSVGVIRADDHLPDIGAISTMRVQLPGSAPKKPIVFRPSDPD